MFDEILFTLGLISLSSFILLYYFIILKLPKMKEAQVPNFENLQKELILNATLIKDSTVVRVGRDFENLITDLKNFLIKKLNFSKNKNSKLVYFKEKQEEKFKDANYWEEIKGILKKK